MDRKQLREFIKENNIKSATDIQNTLKEMFKDVMQEMLEAELDDTLGYAKNDTNSKETENRRNGHSKKTLRSEYGEMELDIPRDREGEFDPVIVKKHQKNVAGIEEQIIALYAKGMSARDIQDHLNQLYGVEVSPTVVSNITNRLMPLIKEWQGRPLQSVYAIAFLDAIHYKVRQEGHIVNKAAYMCVGVDLDGNKDVLG
ncbi:IS256 family transposase, partial [Anaerobacterium chartisolvens]